MAYVSATHQPPMCQCQSKPESRRKEPFGKQCEIGLPNAAILAWSRTMRGGGGAVDRESERKVAQELLNQHLMMSASAWLDGSRKRELRLEVRN